MKTTTRLEQALIKLYNAYHHNLLNPEDCKACAVGNILDNHDSWKHLTEGHGSLKLSYVGRVHENLGRKFNGYSPSEILQIEKVFLDACGFSTPLCHYNKRPINPTSKDVLFDGLSAVIELLCKFDNIKNVMDFSKLFEQENGEPVYHLETFLG
ncbi:MAG: Na(+)-translocating NADH-quinone reductase subunit F [Flavobacteriia bacterium]|nr:Na(+)-translocating NADH-quinone reductase subunit F [Flavobacteriia bacterium]OIP45945.1 MAG: Na(+)-translocating NADH-quinone reductase subunit F [Flavobacteriaceae bacterium CG2_30_31_66]PIV95915.1 MAG: Na(+)-translocating NADH-quinone reductase subunit F [Flavobacteriaceae bacterium CG17_big_fil_post_rev_8_21_14_2_50_31_13]PIX15298.1 MAG: Na(+)-translocating NADH-quinone reductase subunit F [Flavobacteriaceae bacterium CG_4_8_14_3_um_filter_31_8]PIY15400.1 MAG: Na(+)-translocating NADH-q